MSKEYTQQELNDIYDDHIQEIRAIIENYTSSNYVLFIVLPAIDMYANAIHGTLNAPNTMTSFLMMRCACEAIGAIAYFEKNDPTNGYFNLYIKRERIYAYNTKEKKNMEVGIRAQLQCVDDLGISKGFKKYYDLLCKNAHFGPTHFLTMLYKPEKVDKNHTLLRWMVGPKGITGKYRENSVKMTTGLFPVMIEILNHCIKGITDNTNRSNYSVEKGNIVIPKEYREIFKEILRKTP